MGLPPLIPATLPPILPRADGRVRRVVRVEDARSGGDLTDRIKTGLVTSCGLGFAPVASGTFGTLGGVVLAVVSQAFLPEPLVAWVWLGMALILLWVGCALGPWGTRPPWPVSDWTRLAETRWSQRDGARPDRGIA